MSQYIIEVVIDAESKEKAKSIQSKVDRIGPIKSTILEAGFNAYDNNKGLIYECGDLAKQGKKTAMMAKLGTAFMQGKIKF